MKKKIILAISIGLIGGGIWFALSPNNTKSLPKKSKGTYNICDYYNDIIKIAEKMGGNINNIEELVLLYKEYDRLSKVVHDIPHTEICGNYDDFLEAHSIIKYVCDLYFRVDQTLTQTVNDKTRDNETRYDEFQMRTNKNTHD